MKYATESTLTRNSARGRPIERDESNGLSTNLRTKLVFISFHLLRAPKIIIQGPDFKQYHFQVKYYY